MVKISRVRSYRVPAKVYKAKALWELVAESIFSAVITIELQVQNQDVLPQESPQGRKVERNSKLLTFIRVLSKAPLILHS